MKQYALKNLFKRQRTGITFLVPAKEIHRHTDVLYIYQVRKVLNSLTLFKQN